MNASGYTTHKANQSQHDTKVRIQDWGQMGFDRDYLGVREFLRDVKGFSNF